MLVNRSVVSLHFLHHKELASSNVAANITIHEFQISNCKSSTLCKRHLRIFELNRWAASLCNSLYVEYALCLCVHVTEGIS